MQIIKSLTYGLKQTTGSKSNLIALHNPQEGWQLNYPEVPANILLQDDLTYVNGKILEIENYKNYYKSDIQHVVFYVWHKNLHDIYPDLNLVYYPLFHYEHKQDAVKHNVAEKFNFTSDKEFVFLCLNMNRRKHRDQTVKLLQPFPSRLISYKAINWDLHNYSDDWTLDYYQNINISVPHRIILRNTANLLQLRNIYQKCQFSVVTETRYELPFDFVTEKTTQCWLALHPALYVSNQGHVKLLREWGFDVFDDIFDHSYDLLDNDKRISRLVDLNRNVLKHGITDYDSLKDRLLKNRNHYLNNFLN